MAKMNARSQLRTGSTKNEPVPNLSGFRFETIADFDARKPMKRCMAASTGLHEFNQVGVADVWRTRNGELFARFSSQGYRQSAKINMADGTRVPDSELPKVQDALNEILFEWLLEGVDDWYLPA